MNSVVIGLSPIILSNLSNDVPNTLEVLKSDFLAGGENVVTVGVEGGVGCE
jgi:hypothetical protein